MRYLALGASAPAIVVAMPVADSLTSIREPCDLDDELAENTALSLIMNEPGTYGPLGPELLAYMTELCRQVIKARKTT
jgi:hypothetical protein